MRVQNRLALFNGQNYVLSTFRASSSDHVSNDRNYTAFADVRRDISDLPGSLLK